MKRFAVLGLVLAGLVSVMPAPAAAGTWRDGHSVDGRSRSDARVQRRLIEERLARLGSARPVEVEYSTPYLPDVQGDRGVDQQIRRLGELIRREQAAGR